MSLDPSPLSPDPTPLLDPTDPAPGRGAALIGAIISVGLAMAVALVSMRGGTRLLFFAIGSRAQASGVVASSPYQIQGFDYYWTKSYGDTSSVGYTASTTADNIFSSEAKDYHMNLAVITITADVSGPSNTSINYSSTNGDTYKDSVYKALAQQATQDGLTPVFRLAISVQGNQNKDTWPGQIGAAWFEQTYQDVVTAEEQWIDSYTLFAVHYAQLAQTLQMPFFIVGSNLEDMTLDLGTKGKPAIGDTFTCSGRRECEWKHVIAAVRNSGSYHSYYLKKSLAGGGFTGQIIYEATSRISTDGSSALTYYEWDPKYFLWWKAVDIIGIDANFDLTKTIDPSIPALEDAWQGIALGVPLADLQQNGNLLQRLRNLAIQTVRPILFTSAGYESVSGSNGSPGNVDTANQPQDQGEQLNDVQALLDTFSSQPWWLGVVWSSDYAVWPRSSLSTTNAGLQGLIAESDWTTNTEWAGDCLLSGCSHPAKLAGMYFHTNYPIAPLPATIISTLTGP